MMRGHPVDRQRVRDNTVVIKRRAFRGRTSNSELSSMENIFFPAIFVLIATDAALSNNMFRGLRLRVPASYDSPLPYDVYVSPEEILREDRGIVKEPQPLCREIRTELPASLFVPNVESAEIYTFRPQKIYMVNCSREASEMSTADVRSGCWPQHCREKYVDIDIFGKPKSVKENLWQLMMEIPSVPIACECFKIP